MALFRILKGDSSRISTEVTPFHDGYAYFTPDDGGFYIDSAGEDSEERIRINPTTKSIFATLYANEWVDAQQTIESEDITADANGLISLAPDATYEQDAVARNARLNIINQTNGSLTISATGEIPTVDIPVVIILFNAVGNGLDYKGYLISDVTISSDSWIDETETTALWRYRIENKSIVDNMQVEVMFSITDHLAEDIVDEETGDVIKEAGPSSLVRATNSGVLATCTAAAGYVDIYSTAQPETDLLCDLILAKIKVI